MSKATALIELGEESEPTDASTCEHCGGKSWHHTVECFTGETLDVEAAVVRLDQCLADQENGVGAR